MGGSGRKTAAARLRKGGNQNLPKVVFHQHLVAPVREAARQTAQQVDPAIHLPLQQRSAIAGQLTSEPGFHAAR